MADENKILYNSFLKEKNIYNLNSGYWKRKLLNKLDLKFSLENQYVTNKKSNGKNFYDGNPIFSYIENDKAFRIIQENPEDLSSYNNIKLIDAWIDKLYKSENQQIPELVISLYLTRETVDKTIELIKEFRFDNLNKENIEQFL
ncbi:hypothetical protein [Robertkochia solimangrovi]|uniref:hypothetical protein n=1 Tax=Robertkochia solimangrovi TaxID=2213046 RepID=UPI00117F7D27|nr:hypothetical protein [Robertkochia solimangrovi]TRZ45125.1 hypothetical protein DMZ48_05075 [Robertkochia solimangrovi]